LWCSFDHFFLHLGALAAVFFLVLLLAKFRQNFVVAYKIAGRSDVLTKNLENVGFAELADTQIGGQSGSALTAFVWWTWPCFFCSEGRK